MTGIQIGSFVCGHLSSTVFWTYFAHEGAACSDLKKVQARVISATKSSTFGHWSEDRASDWSVNSTTIISRAAVDDGFSVYLSGAVFQGSN